MWPRKLPRLKFLLTSVFLFTFPFSPSQYITVRNGLWPPRVNFEVIKPENTMINYIKIYHELGWVIQINKSIQNNIILEFSKK